MELGHVDACYHPAWSSRTRERALTIHQHSSSMLWALLLPLPLCSVSQVAQAMEELGVLSGCAEAP